MNNEALFFKDKPLFGLDIGNASLKVMQLDDQAKQRGVVGYGAGSFDSAFLKDGLITDIEGMAKAAHELFTKNIVGNITTRRVAISVPASRSYTRNIHLPKLANSEQYDAVLQEVEQYVPVPIADLYFDYSVIRENTEGVELLVVAIPKKLIDRYLELAQVLNLEVVGIEPTIAASGRLFMQAENSDIPTVLVDFGTQSADITIFDAGLAITGTAVGGGDDFTNTIASTLNVTNQEAHIIKTKYGLGVSKKQKEIMQGLKPTLDQMLKEVRRMIRYYEERSGTERKITQVVTMGGGANMPGLSDYMTDELRLPVRMCDPWQNLDFSGLQPPNSAEKSMYVTAAGLALTPPKELFK